MNYSAKTGLTILLLIISLKIQGQGQGQRLGGATPDPEILGGGNGKSGGLNGVFNVNAFDGTANISIPIYNYSVENTDFGVSFSYNTRGVLVDEIASDIGLHWQVNSGPYIQRTLKDLPDEINVLNGDTLMFQWSGSSYMKPLPGWPPAPYDTVSLNQYWAFKGRYAVYSESTTSAADTQIYRDNEADDFTVYLGGSSFTFNLGKGGTFFIHPKRSVKIEVLWDGEPFQSIGDLEPIGEDYGSQNLLSFRITDENGNRYLFRRGDFENKQIDDIYGVGNMVANYNYTTKWVIDEITLASGRKIKYDYYSFSGNGAVAPRYKNNSKREGMFPSDTGPDSFKVHPAIYNTCKLKEIWYPNNVRVNFMYGPFRFDGLIGALKEIRIAAPQNCLRYIMKQSYFASGSDTEIGDPDITATSPTARVSEASRTRRLRLDRILLTSCDSTLQEPYFSFTYDNTKLPPRLDPRQDYFGYFNDGIFLSTNPGQVEADAPTLIPRHHKWLPQYNNYDIYDADAFFMDREPNADKMKACVLTSLTNANGGKATFFYSGHDNLANPLGPKLPTDQYYFGENANDGLRLDSVIEWEPVHPENSKITTYAYAGGQRFISGGYFHSPDRMHGNDLSTAIVGNIIFSGVYVTPHQFVNGSNHGYSNVSITSKSSSGELLGRKTIKFSNFQDDYPGAKPKYFVIGGGKDFFTYPYTDKQYLLDWQIGLPLEVSEYDENDRITQKTVNRYKFTFDTTSSIGSVENRKVGLVIIDGVQVPGISYVAARVESTDDYRPYTGKALVDSTIIYKFITDASFISDVVCNTYDNRDNLSTIYTFNSMGEQIKTIQAYNYTPTSAPGAVLTTMTSGGLEKLIATERWLVSGAGIANDKLLSASFNTFEYSNNILTPRSFYQLETGQPLTYAQYTGYSGGLTPPPFALAGLAFDNGILPNFRRLSEVTNVGPGSSPNETKLLQQDVFNSMIWDTLSGQKLAECNAEYDDIAFSSFELGTNGHWVYNPAGATALTDPVTGRNGFACSYGAVSKSGLTPGKEYMITFWASIGGGAPACSVAGNNITLTAKAEKGNWKYYEGSFTVSSGADVCSVSGPSGTFLDELRLFPRNSTMVTWSYEDIFGVSASTSPNGRVTYYEYDKLGRQSQIKDQDGNILKRIERQVLH